MSVQIKGNYKILPKGLFVFAMGDLMGVGIFCLYIRVAALIASKANTSKDSIATKEYKHPPERLKQIPPDDGIKTVKFGCHKRVFVFCGVVRH